MTGLTINSFDDYFFALHGHAPYPWQRRLAESAVNGDWPGAIDLPTGSGKTACIDVAIFALACQAVRPVHERIAPTRVFFCVNRRVIVDEAFERAQRIAEAIDTNDEPVLRDVAAALRELAGTKADDPVPPLDVLELRGGIYRDNRWARSATQPTVVCTTIDQLGSRLLFRGYGVSSNAAPIQAALIAYDSLILLDEAHISEPFRQTLEHVQRYLDPQKWAERTIGARPVIVVPMTATPPPGVAVDDIIGLRGDDRENMSLERRLTADKPAELREVKEVSSDAAKAAVELAQGQPTAVGIIVNRVATAKQVYEQMRTKYPNDTVELVIGSMRPIDRDEQAKRLHPLVGPNRPEVAEKNSFIVATQCLEVGADYDFDVLVTECASLDALRQRFGRLNRAGRPITAKAVILAAKGDIKSEEKLDKEKPLDPIYGNALTRTWNWLDEHASGNKKIDFGIDAVNALLDQHGDDSRIPDGMLAPSALLNAPVMLPAYVDFWCQTAPRPVPDPDVSLFLHGPQRGEPDVQVCWRADLGEGDNYPAPEQWADVVALLPPTSAECMSVPISRLRHWLAADHEAVKAADHGDLLGVAEDGDNNEGKKTKKGKRRSPDKALKHRGVLWRGAKDSCLLGSTDDLRPGDTIVLPVSIGGWDNLGHLPLDAQDSAQNPDDLRIDRAEAAFLTARNRVALRIHPTLKSLWPPGKAIDMLFDSLTDTDDRPTINELRDLLRAAANDIEQGDPARAIGLRHLGKSPNPIWEYYPNGRGVVLKSRHRFGKGLIVALPALDDGDDHFSCTERDQPVTMAGHTSHVGAALDRALSLLLVETITSAFFIAARLHDIGKADERFQAMLRRTDRTDTWLMAGTNPALLAKSDGLAQTRIERDAARRRAGLPAGFRHEMLSVQLAGESGHLPDNTAEIELILHLIAAHHGHARPFAPVIPDDDPPDVEVDGITLVATDRLDCPPHSLESGIAERFWSLTRRFGWWGLAYLEAVLRLADQQASAAENAEEIGDVETKTSVEANHD